MLCMKVYERPRTPKSIMGLTTDGKCRQFTRGDEVQSVYESSIVTAIVRSVDELEHASTAC